jgi:hypothetical protein
MVEVGCTANIIKTAATMWNASASSSEELEKQESVISDCLNALMNLSTDVDNQREVGALGLELLVDIARESINPALHVFAAKTVMNLRLHPRNRTLLYKTELDLKSSDWSDKFGPNSAFGAGPVADGAPSLEPWAEGGTSVDGTGRGLRGRDRTCRRSGALG